MGLRRVLHDRLNRHSWTEVAHRHGIVIDNEVVDYFLTECPCGRIREVIITRSPIMELGHGFVIMGASVESRELDKIEDAKVWAEA